MSEVLNKTRPRLAVLNHILLFGVSEDNVIKEINSHYTGDVVMGYDLMKIGVGDTIRYDGISQ